MIVCDNCQCRCNTGGEAHPEEISFYPGTEVCGEPARTMCRRCRRLLAAVVKGWFEANEARRRGPEVYEPPPGPPPRQLVRCGLLDWLRGEMVYRGI